MKRLQTIEPLYRPNPELCDRFVFHDAWEEPIEIVGLLPKNEQQEFRRVPADVAEATSSDVVRLSRYTAGACVRFATDAAEICVAAILQHHVIMAPMTLCGESGIELYMEADGEYQRIETARPTLTEDYTGYHPWIEHVFKLPGNGLRTCCLYLPLNNGIKRMLIGLPVGNELASPRKRRIRKPITLYGSSITQGLSVNNPGASYASILGRRLDANIRNLGFNGAAKAESAMVEYLTQLDMSVFILDYDHNAPTVKHLQATHEALFRAVRTAHPNLPIIMLSRPDFDPDPAQNAARREVVRQTWRNAVDAGDSAVWFIDGETAFGKTDRDLCTVDGVHPTSLGSARLADCIEPILRKALADH